MSTKALAIGPANYAGQATTWAKAVRRNLRIHAESLAHRPTDRAARSWNFDFCIDKTVPPLPRPWQRPIDISTIRDYSHIAIDGFLPILHATRPSGMRRDLDALERVGHKSALISHGSDTRDPDAHASRFDYSYFRECPPNYTRALRVQSARNRALSLASGVPTFVSTPDLLLDMPWATWLPLAIDFDRWASLPPGFETRRIPRVLHLPSRRLPPIKGTRVIEPILQDLDRLGLISYVCPDRVLHRDMPSIVGDVDLVVDQIMTGSYGVAAVEAMAAGRLVIGNVSREVRDLLPENPPIVDAAPSRFREVMLDILSNLDQFADTALRGQGYAGRWHAGAASSAALSPFLGCNIAE